MGYFLDYLAKHLAITQQQLKEVCWQRINSHYITVWNSIIIDSPKS
jgi:hypothetical protein